MKVLSPLHIGSGQDRVLTRLKPRDSARNVVPRAAAILRDAAGLPYLPGSAFRGLLTRLSRRALTGPQQRLELFGTAETQQIRDAVHKGFAGRLHTHGSSAYEAGDASKLPYADDPDASDSELLGPGVYVASGTRIDPRVGVADSNTLHHREAVAPGATFSLTCIIEDRGPGADASCYRMYQNLLALFAVLAEELGEPIGAGAADGDGRIQLVGDSIVARRAVVGANGGFSAQPLTTKLPKALPATDAAWSIRLRCPGPFAVLDPAWPDRRTKEQPQLQAQRRSEGEPELPGSSIAGVLRARAAWLLALEVRRSEGEPVPEDGGFEFDRISAVPLTPFQRLFGVTGFQALLQIEAVRLAGAKPWRVASVKLDRFSAEPMSGGLFDTDTFLETNLELRLRLISRPGAIGAATQADKALAERIVEDVRRNGLVLGHGGTKGFGWFEPVEGADGARAG